MGYTSEIAFEPSDIMIGVELTNDMTEITVFLDTDKVVDLAVGASHGCDGSRHDEWRYRGIVFIVICYLSVCCCCCRSSSSVE